jgi:ABC-type sugar transport system permease subunit
MKGDQISLRRSRYHLQIYWFIVPALLFIGLFAYYPAVNGLYHSFYTWNGGDVERYCGTKNYETLFTSNPPEFWISFRNALLLGIANIIKMAPAIITAVCLHRVRNERLQFWYRIGFVIPMVIPEMVVVLLWKAFYDPSNGAVNILLRRSGAMDLLIRFSSASKLLGETGSESIVFRLMLGIISGALVFLIGVFLPGSNRRRNVLVLAALFAIISAFALPGILQSLGTLFIVNETPAWLGAPKLNMLALIVWGFPWVGSFGVLCYLACLQSIDKEIYEAAEVDGANWFSKFRHIEMPLILRQIRVMMILVIMGSLKDAGLVMLLFGIEGGAGGVVQVPALFMFREAFMTQKMGYACGIGVVLFTVIVIMTKLNEKLIKPAE